MSYKRLQNDILSNAEGMVLNGLPNALLVQSMMPAGYNKYPCDKRTTDINHHMIICGYIYDKLNELKI